MKRFSALVLVFAVGMAGCAWLLGDNPSATAPNGSPTDEQVSLAQLRAGTLSPDGKVITIQGGTVVAVPGPGHAPQIVAGVQAAGDAGLPYANIIGYGLTGLLSIATYLYRRSAKSRIDPVDAAIAVNELKARTVVKENDSVLAVKPTADAGDLIPRLVTVAPEVLALIQKGYDALKAAKPKA